MAYLYWYNKLEVQNEYVYIEINYTRPTVLINIVWLKLGELINENKQLTVYICFYYKINKMLLDIIKSDGFAFMFELNWIQVTML